MTPANKIEAVKSFNAATAFRPWRTWSARRAAATPTTFNAATAFRPWRTALIIDGDV